MILPKRITRGDTVGVIAPASPPNYENLQKGITFLQSLGLHVKVGERLKSTYGYLAGTDQERIDDLHSMFADQSVKAVICACGGYGTARISDKLNYRLIANNPKIFWGYSDITYLHTAINQETGLVTFHGPMISSDLAKKDFDQLSKQMFLQLFEPTQIIYTEQLSSLQVVAKGETVAEIIGGNLTLITSTLGTRYEVNTKGKILLIEDVDEAPYRIDSMLNQLQLAGKLDDAAGIVIGNFKHAVAKNELPSLSLDQVLDTYFANLSKPVMKGFNIGHCIPNIAIPLGKAKLSTNDKKLIIAPGVI
ncbi:LD-carboxypeptidase [Aquibacillus halophilus]|uniref:LD-carboxypeptidase n=1 Tax=Aquibacillus halophilus TaxID=930132 RepID=A0A6A8DE73_9BACI|nr:LD-carboxypeptidase [Aquibacillus halophilus]MRH43953.1 LD-carboxypeptidase [Aquibacillus halophilus]